jgi:hypothetical protein
MITPKTIRKAVKDVLSIDIPNSNRIFINPCYPFYVTEKYQKELDKNNIFISPSHFRSSVAVFSYDNNKKDFIRSGDVNSDFIGVDMTIITITPQMFIEKGIGYLQSLVGA